MRVMFWVILAVTLFTVAAVLKPDSEAMTQCTEKHSYDVCFQQLNR